MRADIQTRGFSTDVLDFFKTALRIDNPFVERAVWLALPGTEGLAILNIAREVSDATTHRLVSSDISHLLDFMADIASTHELGTMRSFLQVSPGEL